MENIKNTKILIVEDEVLIANYTLDLLNQIGYLNCVLAYDKEQALRLINEFKPDFIFLDIRMESEKTGIEIGTMIQNEFKIPFSYLTAHSDFALMNEAILTNPISYLTKPIKKADFFASMIIWEKDKINKVTFFYIREGITDIKININDFIYAKSEENYMLIFTKNKKYVVRNTIKNFLLENTFENIKQIHRSYLINVTLIQKIETTNLIIEDIKLPLSRNFRPNLVH